MKKLTICALLSAVVSINTYAEVLSPAQALAHIEESTQTTPGVRRMAAHKNTAMPIKTVSDAAGLPQLYLFADGANGLMIVAAESEVAPLIGHTDTYTLGETLPPALEYMISCYAAEIEALRAGMVTYSNNVVFNVNSPAIAPICTTRWDQTAPYNAQCPTLNGERSVTGCVATAMAQVLKTYEYPTQCSGGTYTYRWSNGGKNLSLNFDEVTLDWAQMGDKYSATESAPAVATLMKALGYASEMKYSPQASGTNSIALAKGLVRNFGYDASLTYELREWYSLGEWQQKIYDAISGGHAVYYDGANPDNSAAHAFVVDGYSSDGYFHLNWGWGGMSDGYFRLSALDPSSQGTGGSTAGYNRGQGAIFNLKPGATTSPSEAPLSFFIQTGFNVDVTSAQLGSYVTFMATNNAGIYNISPNVASSVSLGIKFAKSSGEVIYFKNTATSSNIQSYSGLVCNYSCKLPTNLSEGTYTVSPAVYSHVTQEYYDVHCPVGMGAKITAEVQGQTVTFTNSSITKLTATNVSVPLTIYQNTPFELTAQLLNSSDDDFYGPISAQLYNTGTSTRVASLGTTVVSAAPDETATIGGFFKLEGTSTAVGEYDIILIDQQGNAICEPQLVTVEEAPVQGTPKCTGIRVPNKTQDGLTVNLTLGCDGGMYVNPVYVVITEYRKTEVLTYFPSEIVSINAGESKTVSVKYNFVDGIVGTKYTVYPFYIDNNSLIQMGGLSSSFVLEASTPEINSTLSVSNFVAPTEVTLDEAFSVSATIANNTAAQYNSAINVKLFNAGSTSAIATLGSKNLNLAVGASTGIEIEATATDAIEPGQYEIALVDASGAIISTRKTIAVKAAEQTQGTPQCTDITMISATSNDLRFSMTLSSDGGPFTGSIYAVFAEYGSPDVIATYVKRNVTLDASGEAITLNWKCDFSDYGLPGYRYTIYPFYETADGYAKQILGISETFTLEEEATAIEEVEANDGKVEYYDLNGRRVVNPKNGVFIRKQGSTTSKVVL